MNRKFLWIIVLAFVLLGSFCTAFADQDGRNCWCNIDEYGCWITNEDGGKTYIMFWSEEARLYIMGPGGTPYKLVVKKPEAADFLTLKCGSPEPVVIPTAGPDEKPHEPAADCDISDYNWCLANCTGFWYYCTDSGGLNCEEATEACIDMCNDKNPNCIAQ